MENKRYITPKFKIVTIEHKSSVCNDFSESLENISGIDGGGLDG